jgi:hypothetical protein
MRLGTERINTYRTRAAAGTGGAFGLGASPTPGCTEPGRQLAQEELSAPAQARPLVNPFAAGVAYMQLGCPLRSVERQVLNFFWF